MNESFRISENTVKGIRACDIDKYGREPAEKVLKFHESFPMYKMTPLAELKNTAQTLKLRNLFVKNESLRFDLNAFKVLGGSFAIGNYIASRLGKDISEIGFDEIVSDETKKKLGEITFVTATDGNHGRGVAWAANRFGYKAVVYMPKGTAQERLDNILKENADASITEFNYDECVRLASRMSRENDWVMVQDTAWDGYEDIPQWIMQGYTTMALEAFTQFPEKPTHIFLQAGVGSMAAAVAAFFASVYVEERPKIVVVEPNKADCFYKTALAGDGERRFVTGNMNTIMAGLACGEPCSIAWDILSNYADFFLSCPEYAAATGMRILANPAKGDTGMISGESGASAFGCVAEIMMDEKLSDIKEKLSLDENAVALFISTEGDTDPVNYRSIVWGGAYPSESIAKK